TDHFLRCSDSEEFCHVPAAPDEARLTVLEINTVGAGSEEGPQQMPLLGQLRLKEFPRGDIEQNSLRTDDFSSRVEDGSLNCVKVAGGAVRLEVFFVDFDGLSGLHEQGVVVSALSREPGFLTRC